MASYRNCQAGEDRSNGFFNGDRGEVNIFKTVDRSNLPPGDLVWRQRNATEANAKAIADFSQTYTLVCTTPLEAFFRPS
jgi:hypothetical protein